MRVFRVVCLAAVMLAVMAAGAAFAAAAGMPDAYAGFGIPRDVQLNVVAIEGKRVIEGSRVNVMFGSDGILSGNASVNRYTTNWKRNGDALAIEPCNSTLIMGKQDMMAQEKKFLNLLPKIVKYGVKGNIITLTAADGKTITLEPLPLAM